MTLQLNGTIANWQLHKSALESGMYELGVGHLLDMADGDVPAAPVALTADNASTVGLQTRNLVAHRQDDVKGFMALGSWCWISVAQLQRLRILSTMLRSLL